MTKRRLLGILSILVIASAVYLAGAASIRGSAATADTEYRRLPDRPASVDSVLLDAPLGDLSLYHLGSVWMNRDSQEVTWSSFRGRPILVAMFYTHCGYTCPRIVHDLKGILSELPRSERRTVGVVLVSIDPEHDTPEALTGFGEMHGLERPQWNLLTGRDRDIRELAAVLNVRYQRQPDGAFAHSNTMTLLGPNGEILAQQDALSASRDELVAALTRLVSEPR